MTSDFRYAHIRAHLPSGAVRHVALAVHDGFTPSATPIVLHLGAGDRSWRADHTVDGSGVATAPAVVRATPLATRPARRRQRGRWLSWVRRWCRKGDLETLESVVPLFTVFFLSAVFSAIYVSMLVSHMQDKYQPPPSPSPSPSPSPVSKNASDYLWTWHILSSALAPLSSWSWPSLGLRPFSLTRPPLPRATVLARSLFPRDVVHTFELHRPAIEDVQPAVHEARNSVLLHPAAIAMGNQVKQGQGESLTKELHTRLADLSRAFRDAVWRLEKWMPEVVRDWEYLGNTFESVAGRINELRDPAEIGLFDYISAAQLAQAEWGDSLDLPTTFSDGSVLGGDESGSGSGSVSDKHDEKEQDSPDGPSRTFDQRTSPPSPEGAGLRRGLRRRARAVLCRGFEAEFRSRAQTSIEMGRDHMTPLVRLYRALGRKSASGEKESRAHVLVRLMDAMLAVQDAADAAAAAAAAAGAAGAAGVVAAENPTATPSAAELRSLATAARQVHMRLRAVTAGATGVADAISHVCVELEQWSGNDGAWEPDPKKARGALQDAGDETERYDERGMLRTRPKAGEGEKPRGAGGAGEARLGWDGVSRPQQETREDKDKDEDKRKRGEEQGDQRVETADDTAVWVGMPPIYWASRLFGFVGEVVYRHEETWRWKLFDAAVYDDLYTGFDDDREGEWRDAWYDF